MATAITKWTREKGGRKDFVDSTRRSHQPLRVILSSSDAARMREMAGLGREEAGKGMEEREDVMVRRRIEKLRALLHDVNLEEEVSCSSSSNSSLLWRWWWWESGIGDESGGDGNGKSKQ